MIMLGIIFLLLLIEIVYATIIFSRTGNETEWSATPKDISPQLPKTSGCIVKPIKWILILLAILALLKFICNTGLPWRANISEQWSGVYRRSNFFFPLGVVLAGFFVIYPKFHHDLWIQRFLGGIILLFLPLWAIYFGISAPFLSLLDVLDNKFKFISISILSSLLFFILPFTVMIFLCFFLKKKVKSLSEKAKNILKYILLFPLGIGILTSLLFLMRFYPFITLLGTPFLFIIALIVVVPAIINGDHVPKKLLYSAYVGIGATYFFLAIGYYALLYYGFVGE